MRWKTFKVKDFQHGRFYTYISMTSNNHSGYLYIFLIKFILSKAAKPLTQFVTVEELKDRNIAQEQK